MAQCPINTGSIALIASAVHAVRRLLPKYLQVDKYVQRTYMYTNNI